MPSKTGKKKATKKSKPIMEKNHALPRKKTFTSPCAFS